MEMFMCIYAEMGEIGIYRLQDHREPGTDTSKMSPGYRTEKYVHVEQF